MKKLERKVALYYYDCPIPDCDDPKGFFDTDKQHAWEAFMDHLRRKHFDEVIPYLITRVKKVEDE